jgi:hypothetical protein
MQQQQKLPNIALLSQKQSAQQPTSKQCTLASPEVPGISQAIACIAAKARPPFVVQTKNR